MAKVGYRYPTVALLLKGYESGEVLGQDGLPSPVLYSDKLIEVYVWNSDEACYECVFRTKDVYSFCKQLFGCFGIPIIKHGGYE